MVDRAAQFGYAVDALLTRALRLGVFVLRAAFLTLGTAALIWLFAWALLLLLDALHPVARGAILRR